MQAATAAALASLAGRALTEAKDFELKNSGAGLAADITWTGYRKRTATAAS